MLKKILIVLLLTIPLFFLSWNFKYYSQNYNIADSAVYNQVLNSIIFQGETGSSLELGGERSTFNIHFSPIFLLLAPF
ncbi:MAG TPA: hypothetical protein PLM75_00875, partial [bacterium]|nr:hypothetical protein [bacterium]